MHSHCRVTRRSAPTVLAASGLPPSHSISAAPLATWLPKPLWPPARFTPALLLGRGCDALPFCACSPFQPLRTRAAFRAPTLCPAGSHVAAAVCPGPAGFCAAAAPLLWCCRLWPGVLLGCAADVVSRRSLKRSVTRAPVCNPLHGHIRVLPEPGVNHWTAIYHGLTSTLPYLHCVLL